MSTALFIGRFQPFHNAHLKDIKKILATHKKLIIGIGSSNKKNTEKNPFSCNERNSMIQKVLKNNKISNYEIYPVPDFYDDVKWMKYIAANLPEFDIAYSGNNWTLQCFKKHKLNTKKISLFKGINSTIIRQNISQGKKWENLVPKEIFNFINQPKYKNRIK